MTQKMHIHWDAESDYLEVRFGKATESYYEDVGDDVFERHDEKTDEVTGYAFFNVQKRMKIKKAPQDIVVAVPSVLASSTSV